MPSLRIDAGADARYPEDEVHFHSPSSWSSCEGDLARTQAAPSCRPVQAPPGPEMLVQFGPAACSSSVETMLRGAKRRRKMEWSQEEDLAILTSVRKFGTQWVKIAAELPDRTADAVRNRWHRIQKTRSTHTTKQVKTAADALLACGASPVAEESDSQLSPSGKRECIRGSDHGRSMWTDREDALIRDGVARHGCKWRIIAATLTGRSDSSVRNRWMRIFRDLAAPPSANSGGFGAAYAGGAGAAHVQTTPVVLATLKPNGPVGVAQPRWEPEWEAPVPAYAPAPAHTHLPRRPPMAYHGVASASAAPAAPYEAHGDGYEPEPVWIDGRRPPPPCAYSGFEPVEHPHTRFTVSPYSRQHYSIPHPQQKMYPPPAQYEAVYGPQCTPPFGGEQYEAPPPHPPHCFEAHGQVLPTIAFAAPPLVVHGPPPRPPPAAVRSGLPEVMRTSPAVQMAVQPPRWRAGRRNSAVTAA